MTGHGWSAGERVWSRVATAAVVGAALYPLRQWLRPEDRRRDGFPLSYYPMFSARRGKYGYVTYVEAERGDGSRYTVPLSVLGSGGANQIRRQIFRVAVRQGRPEDYARLAAEQVARHPKHTDVVRVRVVRGKFDLDACLLQREVSGEIRLLAEAEVSRTQAKEPVA
ncbi:hypothetical protein GCM10023321_43410 [Pseudonocardia eucalypti]|uniref:Uncharacterized protein n=1 Tax=Pseudonocardia eucalypti TaxID=648755 RepID=A0ABP9QEC8_9PSEU|nr:hypothetical protein [Pseudonocardia eucalypti]